MKKVLKRTAIYLMAFAVAFTALPSIVGNVDVHAATYRTPAQVKGVGAKMTSDTAVRLTWKKAARTNKGYIIYRNGEKFKVRNKKYLYLNVKNLKPATKYSFQVLAYNRYVRKMYYNTTKKKWQYAKPSSKDWKTKKTKKGYYYKYGKKSSAVMVAMPPAEPDKVTGVKASAIDSSSIKVSWTGLSQNLTSYAIYRDGTKVGSVPKGTNSFTDKGLKASTSYSYKVRAYNYSSKVEKGKYGDYSDADTAKTKGAGNGDKDALFAKSTLKDKTLYIDKNNSYTDRLYKVETSKTSQKDAIKWDSSNKNVATIAKDLNNGSEALITVVGTGKTKITAECWDGQSRTATVTVKRFDNGQGGSGQVEEERDDGITTSQGVVYPDKEGSLSFTLAKGSQCEFSVSGVELDLTHIVNSFPTGSTFNVNANSVRKLDYYEGGEVYDQLGYYAAGSHVTNVSNKSVIMYTGDKNSVDAAGFGIFFVDKGVSQITFSNGKIFTFNVSGRNDQVYNYREFIKSFVAENKGKSKMEVTEQALNTCLKQKYGGCDEPLAMVTFPNTGGNCFAKAKLMQRLLTECGVECYRHISKYGDTEGTHQVLEILIDGTTYIADPTNCGILYSWGDYEKEEDAYIRPNRVSSYVVPKIVY